MLDTATIESFVRLAQAEAEQAAALGNPPFGAALTDGDGNLIAAAHNTQISDGDPTAHAEINLLRVAAKKLGMLSFPGYRVFTNAEPCSMCLSAMIKAKIHHIYYGAPHEPHIDPALSAAEIVACSKEPVTLYPGILEADCKAQIARARQTTQAPD